MNSLSMDCTQCRVASTCPKRGSSPLALKQKIDGKTQYKCEIIGGYGRTPINPDILSKKSKKLAAKNGPCLTLAHVPYVDEGGNVSYEVVKIFSLPVLHAREANQMPLGQNLYPRSGGND